MALIKDSALPKEKLENLKMGKRLKWNAGRRENFKRNVPGGERRDGVREMIRSPHSLQFSNLNENHEPTDPRTKPLRQPEGRGGGRAKVAADFRSETAQTRKQERDA